MLSDAMDRRLPWPTRIRMHVHLRMCQVCRRYQHQLSLLRDLLRRTPHSETEAAAPPPRLSAEAKARIRRALDPPHS